MFEPPMRANRLRVSSPPSISASRRSISSPPMIATELMLPTARNRPRRCEPPMTATIQRTGFLVLDCSAGYCPASAGRSLVRAARSPRVLATRARPDRSSSSSRVSRPTAALSPSARSVTSRSASETRRDSSGSLTTCPLQSWPAEQQEYAATGGRRKPRGAPSPADVVGEPGCERQGRSEKRNQPVLGRCGFQPGFYRPLPPRRQALVAEQADAGLVGRVAARRGLEHAVSVHLVAGLLDPRDDLLEPGSEPVAGHRRPVAGELLRAQLPHAGA